MEQNFDKDLDIESLAWKLFELTGDIRYYLFFKELQNNKTLEKTEPVLFEEREETEMVR